MKKAIVNINLEYKFDDKVSDEEVQEYVENVELPSNYVSDSFELVKIMEGEE